MSDSKQNARVCTLHTRAFLCFWEAYGASSASGSDAILKKVCRIAYKEGYAERCFFANFTLPKQMERTPRALSREDFEKIRDVEIPAWRTTHILAR